jgi:hypothetical protein
MSSKHVQKNDTNWKYSKFYIRRFNLRRKVLSFTSFSSSSTIKKYSLANPQFRTPFFLIVNINFNLPFHNFEGIANSSVIQE